MIIRYRLHPRPKHITPLFDRITQTQEEDEFDYSNYLTRTLNPQQPHKDLLSQGRRQSKQERELYHREPTEFSFKNGKCLSIQKPLTLDHPHQQGNSLTQKQVRYDNSPYASLENPNNSLNHRQQMDSQRETPIVSLQLHNHKRIRQNRLNYSSNKKKQTSEQIRYSLNDKDEIKQPIIQKESYQKRKINEALWRIKSININQNGLNAVHFDSQTNKQHANTQNQSINSRYSEIHDQHHRYHTKDIVTSHAKKQVQKIRISTKTRKQIPSEPIDQLVNTPLVFNQKAATEIVRNIPNEEIESIPSEKPTSLLVAPASKKQKVALKTKQFINISYKTTILQLKELCARKDLDQFDINFKIPQLLSHSIFSKLDNEQKLFIKAGKLLTQLGMNNIEDLSMRRYSNCIIIFCDPIAVVSHFTGKFYIGGWKNEYKNGLGLQYLPKKYVYYGQFQEGKRHGIGILKGINNDILAGLWKNSMFQKQSNHHSFTPQKK